MPDPAIIIQGVDKWFGQTRAVKALDLTVPAGSLCGFLGPNGAGKSTTIRMIMSIIYPDAGSIRVLGGSALNSKDRIGYLPEERGVYRKMRVGEFLEYMARLKGCPRQGLSARIDAWLERIELPEVRRQRCEELSKGMQQKIQFLAAIIHDPELLILDEPFSGLDPVNVQLLTELIREQHDHGKTVIFSTHILHQAEQLCDRIFLIHKGEKLLDATLEEIRQQFNPRTILAEPMNGTTDLLTVPDVQSVRKLDDTASFEIELREGANPQEVMRRVFDAGPMRSVELRQLTLSEVFVRMVQEDAGPAAADEVREELEHV